MAESGFSSASESDEELPLEFLSGFVKTVYKSFKEKVVPPSDSHGAQEESESREPPEIENFHKVVCRAAKSLNLDTCPYEPIRSKLMRLLPVPDRVLLKLDEEIVKQCQTVWEKPASATPVHKVMDRKYRVPRDSLIHCFSHPTADSVVVEAASSGRTRSATEFQLSDIESKVMDSIGKRAYHSGGLALRQANIASVFARYNHQLWSQLADILETLPEELKAKALELQKEGLAASDVSLQIAHDQADVAARIMGTGITLRRRAWLRVTSYTVGFQSQLLDLPFDGVNLFGPATEKVITERESKANPSNVIKVAKSPGANQAAAKSPGANQAAAKSPGAGTQSSATGPRRKRKRRSQPSASESATQQA